MVFIFAIVAILAVAAPAAAETVLPGYTNIYVGVANDAGLWNFSGNDTCLTNRTGPSVSTCRSFSGDFDSYETNDVSSLLSFSDACHGNTRRGRDTSRLYELLRRSATMRVSVELRRQ